MEMEKVDETETSQRQRWKDCQKKKTEIEKGDKDTEIEERNREIEEKGVKWN